MIYSRNIFQGNKWTTSDVLVDDVFNGGVYYEPHSNILYGNVCDVAEENTNENGYDESKWMGKIYKIVSGGAVTTYATENIDAIENHVWYGINENGNSIYYAPTEGKVLEYNYSEKEIENSWKNVRCIDLCVTNRAIYGLESKDVAVIRVMEDGVYEPREINFPEIKNPLAMDIVDDIIFILNEDGVYTSDVTQPQKVEKIFDCQSATIDFEYLNDFQVVNEEMDYAIYMSSFDDMIGKYVTNEIKR